MKSCQRESRIMELGLENCRHHHLSKLDSCRNAQHLTLTSSALNLSGPFGALPGPSFHQLQSTMDEPSRPALS